jgi:hypothetical protein
MFSNPLKWMAISPLKLPKFSEQHTLQAMERSDSERPVSAVPLPIQFWFLGPTDVIVRHQRTSRTRSKKLLTKRRPFRRRCFRQQYFCHLRSPPVNRFPHRDRRPMGAEEGCVEQRHIPRSKIAGEDSRHLRSNHALRLPMCGPSMLLTMFARQLLPE